MSTVVATPVARLEEGLRPARALHHVWRRKLLKLGGREAWLLTARDLYHAMANTAPLLNHVAAVSAGRDEFAPLENWARKHAEEEKEHSAWFLEDLSSIGLDPAVVRGSVPSQEVTSVIGTQYVLTATLHPASALGYFYAFECSPSSAAGVRAVARELQLPETAFRTILYHTEVDLQHQLEIRALVEQYGEDPVAEHAMRIAGDRCLLSWADRFRTVSGVIRHSRRGQDDD